MAATVSQNPNYPSMFRAGIVRATGHLLARIQQPASYLLPSENVREQVLHTLRFALIWDDAWPVARDLLLQMAPKMEQAGSRKEWMPYLQRGRKQSQKLGDVEAEAELCFQLGRLYRHQADYSQARGEFLLSLERFDQLGNQELKGRAYNRLAGIARHERKFEEATRLVEMALELVGEAEDEKAYSYLVLGMIAYDQRNWENAHHFLEKSLALWELTNNPRMIAWGLTNLGAALQKSEKYKKAIACYKQAIKLFETIQDSVNQATASKNLGNVYLEINDFANALELYLDAESIFRQTHDLLRLAALNNNKGMAFQKLQQWSKAKRAYLSSIEQFRQIGNIKLLVNTMDNLGEMYLEQELYDEATTTFQDAYKQLVQIKNDPSYEYFFAMVTRHLRQTIELSGGTLPIEFV